MEEKYGATNVETNSTGMKCSGLTTVMAFPFVGFARTAMRTKCVAVMTASGMTTWTRQSSRMIGAWIEEVER